MSINNSWFIPLAELSDDDIKMLIDEGIRELTKWSKSLVFVDNQCSFNSYEKHEGIKQISREEALDLLYQYNQGKKASMKERFTNRKVVKGAEAGPFTVTQDEGMAKDYESLIEVETESKSDSFAYYFVNDGKADLFIAGLNK